MISEIEIREQLARFLANEISLDEFEDWFVQKSWNAHKESAPSAQQLVSAIELRLAEHSSGHLADQELRAELRPLVEDYSVRVSLDASKAAPEFRTGTSDSVVTWVGQVGQPFGIRLSVAYVS